MPLGTLYYLHSSAVLLVPIGNLVTLEEGLGETNILGLRRGEHVTATSCCYFGPIFLCTNV